MDNTEMRSLLAIPYCRNRVHYAESPIGASWSLSLAQSP